MANVRLQNRDWRQSIRNGRQGALHLLVNQMVCDCRFMLGDDKKVIGAHRSYLVVASPVFEAMFCGDLQPDPSEPIRIPDVDYDDFVYFLRYVYSGTIEFGSFDHACYVGYIAKKYMVPDLFHKCCTYMASNVTPKTTWKTVELGNLYDDESLKYRGMDFIRCRTADALADPSFVDQ